jgi:hypothetical protein
VETLSDLKALYETATSTEMTDAEFGLRLNEIYNLSPRELRDLADSIEVGAKIKREPAARRAGALRQVIADRRYMFFRADY